jgi:protease I
MIGGSSMTKNKKVLCFISADFEDLELWYPKLRLEESGYTVDLAGEKKGVTYKGKYGVPATSDVSWDDVDYKSCSGLLIPGGWAPDKLRRFDKVLEITRYMAEHNKPIGQICHAGWVLASAEVLNGRKVTSTPGIKDDLRHAGAEWVNQPVVVDGNLVSGRWPKDLPYYTKAFIDLLDERE